MKKITLYTILLLQLTAVTAKATNFEDSKNIVNCSDSALKFVQQLMSITESNDSYQIVLKPYARGNLKITSIDQLRVINGINKIYLTFPKQNCTLGDQNEVLDCSVVIPRVREEIMFAEKGDTHLDKTVYLIKTIYATNLRYNAPISFNLRKNSNHRDKFDPGYFATVTVPTQDGNTQSWIGAYDGCSFTDQHSILELPADLMEYLDRRNKEKDVI